MANEESEFDNIIKSNNLENFEGGLSISKFAVKDMIEGVSTIGEATMYIMDFVCAFYMSLDACDELEDRPSLSDDSIQTLNIMFESARRFCDILIEQFQSEEDDEEE